MKDDYRVILFWIILFIFIGVHHWDISKKTQQCENACYEGEKACKALDFNNSNHEVVCNEGYEACYNFCHLWIDG